MLSRWRALAFSALVFLHLVPVWAVAYPPSGDGPAHLESARALLDRASAAPSVDREYLALRRDPSVSWFASLALAGLMLGASPMVALKLFMIGCLLLFACAMHYALTSVDRRAGWLSLLALPLLYNTLFLYGFYSFLYGVAVMLFTVGHWLRGEEGTLGASWRLTGLALALQLTHVFALMAAVVTLAVLGLARALTRQRAEGFTRALATHVVAPLYAFLPALVLAVVFLLPRLDARAEPDAPAVRFLRSFPLLSYGDEREAWLAGGVAALVAIVGLMVAAQGLRRRRLVEADALLVVGLFWLAFWVGAPERMAHGSFLAERAALCLLVTLLLWCASRPLRGWARATSGALAVTIALGLLGLHIRKAREVSGQVEAYVAAASGVAPGSALLPLGTSHPVPPARVPFLEHAASYVALARHGINLGNYQFAADHFPLTFRQRRGLGGWPDDGGELSAPEVARWLDAQNGPVDVVLWWGPAEARARGPESLTILQRTARGGPN